MSAPEVGNLPKNGGTEVSIVNKRMLSGLAALVLLWAACGGGSDTGKNQAPLAPVSFGVNAWIGFMGFYVADRKGYFREEGLDLKLNRFSSLGENNKSFVRGEVNGCGTSTLDAADLILQGMDHRVVLVTDYSGGADAILAGPGIRGMNDFNGKRVAYEFGTLEEFFFTHALTQAGLSLKDVVRVDADAERSAKLLGNGEVDAAVTYEPFITKFITTGNPGVKAVYTSVDCLGVITDVAIFQAGFVRNHPDRVQAFIRGYFRAIQLWKDHPEEVHAIMAKEFGATESEIAAQLKGVQILDRPANDNAFSYQSGLKSLYGNMRKAAVFIQERRKTENPALMAPDSLVEPKFIRGQEAP